MNHPDGQPPHAAGFAGEPLARALHRSVTVSFGTGASYRIGSISLRKVGYGNQPRLLMTAHCKLRDLTAVIPICRQRAFGYLAERGVCDQHLAFRPYADTHRRRRRFIDQHDQARMGEVHDISFALSDTLTAAVCWEWNGAGTLPAAWEL